MKNLSIISNEDVLSLEHMVRTIKNTVKAHSSLEKKLKLHNKINGFLGEAMGLIKLFEFFGDKAEYCWSGKFTKDYDVLVKNQNITTKIQIKCSAHNNFVFRVAKVNVGSFEEKQRIIQDVTRTPPSYERINKKIDFEIEKMGTDIWILVHMKEDREDIYALKKDEMINLVKEHYKKANEHRIRAEKKGRKTRKFNGYISTQNVYHPIIQQKRKEDVELLKAFKNRNLNEIFG
jgi:hypothetical protein